MAKNKDIIVREYDLAKPTQVVEMANVLKKHIVGHKLYVPIGGKNYVQVEGWAFAGGLLGLFPRMAEVINLSTDKEIKWLAKCEVLDRAGKVASVGYALCSNKESKKRTFDEYAVLSMAETRSIGKAYRNIIGWVIKLADYESTPAEEMSGVPDVNRSEKPVAPTQPKKGQVVGPDGKATYLCSVCDAPITDQEGDYSLKIYGNRLCRADQKTAKRKK